MAETKIQTRKEFERALIMKAWKNPAFAKALQKDPKGALQKELNAIDPNFKLPDQMKITILQEDANNLYIVIPEHPQDALKRAEFSDEQLESAAGGSISVVAVVGVTVAGVANTAVGVNAQLAGNVNTEANTNALHNVNVNTNVNA